MPKQVPDAAVTIMSNVICYCSIMLHSYCCWYLVGWFHCLGGPLAGSGKIAVSTAMIPKMSCRVGTTSAPGGLQWQRSLQMLQSLQALRAHAGLWMIMAYFGVIFVLLRNWNYLGQLYSRKTCSVFLPSYQKVW